MDEVADVTKSRLEWDAKFAKEGVKLLRMAVGEWPRPRAAICSTIEAPARRILKEHLDSPTGRAWGDMLRRHAEWLNGWHRRLEERDGDGEPRRVELDDYWNTLAGSADDPHVVMDVVHGAGDLAGQERRLVVIRCSPYHDEGGPSTLTGWLEWDDGQRWVGSGLTNAQSSGSLDEEPCWLLRGMVQDFDTIHDLIVSEGRVLPPKE